MKNSEKLKYDLKIKSYEKLVEKLNNEIRRKNELNVLYECELDILCVRIDKAIRYCDKKNYKKVNNILKGLKDND